MLGGLKIENLIENNSSVKLCLYPFLKGKSLAIRTLSRRLNFGFLTNLLNCSAARDREMWLVLLCNFVWDQPRDTIHE